jgi:hypothetical protein
MSVRSGGTEPRNQKEADTMSPRTTLAPEEPDDRALAGITKATLARTGEVEIAGQRYVTANRLANILNVTARTLARWDAARIGPPKIKIGRLRLYDLSKLPAWLAARESEPVRGRRH